MMKEIFSLKNVDLVFGKRPRVAFSALDQGLDREEIQKDTGQVVAIHNLSLSVHESEILVIMGLSGSGKSSLLRCLNGMNGRGTGVLRGEVKFRSSDPPQEVDVIRCREQVLRQVRQRQISMVFQQFGLMPWRTVGQNVLYPLELVGFRDTPRELCEEKMREKLKLVGLEKWKNRYPHELSGGMQQRVGLARAFVTDAPVLLMDEPFSALDPLHRKQLQDEVLQLQKELNKTVVFVTHDLNEALRIGDRIAVMDAGKILQLGAPQELLSRPATERVRQFTEVVH
jgi:glycine betaine/proline transport system ATP-binding protein